MEVEEIIYSKNNIDNNVTDKKRKDTKVAKILLILVLVLICFMLIVFSMNNQSENTHLCSYCNEPYDLSMKFCSNCGNSFVNNTNTNSNSNYTSYSGNLTSYNFNENLTNTRQNDGYSAQNTSIANSSALEWSNHIDINELIKIYGTHIDLNSADGVEVYIEWENLSQKDIKYIYFKTELYNRVNDIISCDVTGEDVQWISQTGPIPYGKGLYDSSGKCRPFRPNVTEDEYEIDDTNGWRDRFWDCVWYNSQAYYIKIVGVEIEYMDGSSFSENDPKIFEGLGIKNLNITEDVSDFFWVYDTTAELLASGLPYKSENLSVESLLVDDVIATGEGETIFTCKFKGYSFQDTVTLSCNVIDSYGNKVNDVSCYVHIVGVGDFEEEFYVSTPTDGVYYVIIEMDY